MLRILFATLHSILRKSAVPIASASVFLLSAAAALTSCDHYLDQMPQNQIRPSTTDDFTQLLNKAYITEQIMPYLDVLSDDVDLISSNYSSTSSYHNPNLGDKMLSAYMWEVTHELSMTPGDIAFEKFYQSIYYTNLVLQEIGHAQSSSLTGEELEAVRDNIRGEALALRAWSYFYLVNLYAAPYDPHSAASAPGVPYTEDTYAEDMIYRRSSVQEIYDHIRSDLETAVQLLQAHPSPKSSKFKFNARSAEALLARVYLYTCQWERAARAAENVLEACPEVASLQEAAGHLTPENNEMDYVAKIDLWGEDYLQPSRSNILFVNGVNELLPAMSSWPIFTTFSVNPELADCYEKGDIRRQYFLVTYNVNLSFLGKKVRKLIYAKNRNIRPLAGPSLDAGYTRVLRTEELYLILAEASVRQGKMEEAAAALNTLRKPKFRPESWKALEAGDFTPDSLLEEIFLERRRELCFEGQRWFDLRRSGCPAQERTGYEGKTARLEKNDPRYVLQIPQYELTVNPEIGANPR